MFPPHPAFQVVPASHAVRMVVAVAAARAQAANRARAVNVFPVAVLRSVQARNAAVTVAVACVVRVVAKWCVSRASVLKRRGAKHNATVSSAAMMVAGESAGSVRVDPHVSEGLAKQAVVSRIVTQRRVGTTVAVVPVEIVRIQKRAQAVHACSSVQEMWW